MNYNIDIYRRNGKLYAKWYEDTILRRKSLGLDATKPNIAYAQRQIIPQLQTELAKHKRLFARTDLRYFVDIVLSNITNSSTYASYEVGIDKFFNYFGSKSLETYTILDMDKYIAELARTLAPSTVRLYIAPMNMAFNEAIRVGLIQNNPFRLARKPKMRNRERRVYTVTQMWQLLHHESDIQTFLYIAFLTGARAGEVLGLKWSDIDFENSKIHIRCSRGSKGVGLPKSGKTRIVPMVNILSNYLAELPKSNGYIVPFTYMSVVRKFRELCEKCGFFCEGLHNTRHTFTSLMLQAKENPLLVKEFLGHSDLTMINRVYAHYIQDIQDCTKFCSVLTQSA